MRGLIDVLVTNAASIQAALFAVIIIVCWGLEKTFLDANFGRKRQRAGVNVLFAVCALPIQISMTAGCVFIASWVTTQQWGLLHQIPWHDNPWVKYGAMFVLLDFLDYIYHFLMHHVPLFWRFHLVHHTDQAIDASTTVREHPGETVVRNGFLIVWVVLCGASFEVLLLRQTVETVANILGHTSFRLGAGAARVLGWLLITPNLHHVHHHNRLPYTNSNYGDVFSLWDRLFGTLTNLAAEDTVFGLDTRPSAVDHSFRSALSMPFESATVVAMAADDADASIIWPHWRQLTVP